MLETAFKNAPRWWHTTPLGSPVVPEVDGDCSQGAKTDVLTASFEQAIDTVHSAAFNWNYVDDETQLDYSWGRNEQPGLGGGMHWVTPPARTSATRRVVTGEIDLGCFLVTLQ